MASPTVEIDVALETQKARRELQKLNNQFSKFSNTATKDISKVDVAVGSLVGNLGANIVSSGLSLISRGFSELTVGAIESAAAIEKLKTQFEVLTGSQEKAGALFQELTDFSASTPFQLNNIAEASAQLLSFGFEAEGVTERIGRIGEVAAGSNSDLKEVALIYGQVSAAGKLTGERLLQLQERAIPIGSALANSLGVAESEVRELVSSGTVGFKEFEAAFNSLSDAGGLFEGAIDKQSKTLNGSLSTLNDNFEILKASIGELIAPAVLAGVQGLTGFFQDLNKAITGGTPAQKIQDISNQIIVLRDRLGDTNKLEIVARNSGQNVEKVTESIKRQIEALRNRATELSKGVKTEGPSLEVVDTGKIEEENTKILELRRKLKKDLALIEADAKIKEAEIALGTDDITAEQRQLQLNNILAFENEKADINASFAEEENKRIQDSSARRTANELSAAKESLLVATNIQKQRKIIRQQELKDEQVFFGLAKSLSSSENKSLAAIGKAAGLLQIAQATPPAIASSFAFGARIGGPPLGFAFAGIAGAAQAAQAANLAKFATGGFVNSGTNTGDNNIIRVNGDEAVLNKKQQNEFMKIANGNASGGSELIEKIDTLIDIIQSQPVMVQIDGREVFRAVREEQVNRGAA